MLRHASRALFVARNRALLAGSSRVVGAGSVPLTKEDADFQKKTEARQAAMRKVGATDQQAANAQRFEDRYQERDQAPSLWERAKEAAQAVKDSVASNAQKAQEAATVAKDDMSEKMQSTSESIKDSFTDAKETISEKYENAKEAVGEKLDNISDSLQGRKGTQNRPSSQQKDKSRTQPLGKTYTKVDMSLKSMNEEITLADMQGNLSHDDEVIAHAAARAENSDAFHSMGNISNSMSTEDLTIQGNLRPDAQAAAEHRADREKNKKYRDITYSGDEEFFEPQQQVNRQKQNFSENIKDTKQAADHTWDKAGSNFVRGLEKTAEHIQGKDAKKFDKKDQKSAQQKPKKQQKSAQQLWDEGNAVTQSWNEVLADSEKRDEKEQKSQRKGPAFGLEDLTGSDSKVKKSEVKKQDKEMQEKQAKELVRGKRQKKGPMYGMEDLTGPTEANADQKQDQDQDRVQLDRDSGRQEKKGKETKEARNKKDDNEACSRDQKQTQTQAKKGQVEDKEEINMAERSQKASASSKARGSNDVKGLSKSTGDDAANEKSRNIPKGTPASSTY